MASAAAATASLHTRLDAVLAPIREANDGWLTPEVLEPAVQLVQSQPSALFPVAQELLQATFESQLDSEQALAVVQEAAVQAAAGLGDASTAGADVDLCAFTRQLLQPTAKLYAPQDTGAWRRDLATLSKLDAWHPRGRIWLPAVVVEVSRYQVRLEYTNPALPQPLKYKLWVDRTSREIDRRDSRQLTTAQARAQSWRISLAVGSDIDVLDTVCKWYASKVVEQRGSGDSAEVKVHFLAWGSRYDEWMSRWSARIQPLQARTKSKPEANSFHRALATGNPVDFCHPLYRIWSRATVLAVNDFQVQLQVVNPSTAKEMQYQPWVHRFSRNIAAPGSKLLTHELATSQPSEAWRASLLVGQELDALDTACKWYRATVLSVSSHERRGKEVRIHYCGWPTTYDEWISLWSPRLAPLHTHAKLTDVPPLHARWRAYDLQVGTIIDARHYGSHEWLSATVSSLDDVYVLVQYDNPARPGHKLNTRHREPRAISPNIAPRGTHVRSTNDRFNDAKEQWRKGVKVDAYVDVLDTVCKWCRAKVTQLRGSGVASEISVTYPGWGSQYDEWVPLWGCRVAQPNTRHLPTVDFGIGRPHASAQELEPGLGDEDNLEASNTVVLHRRGMKTPVVWTHYRLAVAQQFGQAGGFANILAKCQDSGLTMQQLHDLLAALSSIAPNLSQAFVNAQAPALRLAVVTGLAHVASSLVESQWPKLEECATIGRSVLARAFPPAAVTKCMEGTALRVCLTLMRNPGAAGLHNPFASLTKAVQCALQPRCDPVTPDTLCRWLQQNKCASVAFSVPRWASSALEMLHFLNTRNAVTEGDVGAILDNLLRSPAHRQAGGEVLLHTSIVWSSQLLACMLRKLVSHLEAAGISKADLPAPVRTQAWPVAKQVASATSTSHPQSDLRAAVTALLWGLPVTALGNNEALPPPSGGGAAALPPPPPPPPAPAAAAPVAMGGAGAGAGAGAPDLPAIMTQDGKALPPRAIAATPPPSPSLAANGSNLQQQLEEYQRRAVEATRAAASAKRVTMLGLATQVATAAAAALPEGDSWLPADMALPAELQGSADTSYSMPAADRERLESSDAYRLLGARASTDVARQDQRGAIAPLGLLASGDCAGLNVNFLIACPALAASGLGAGPAGDEFVLCGMVTPNEAALPARRRRALRDMVACQTCEFDILQAIPPHPGLPLMLHRFTGPATLLRPWIARSWLDVVGPTARYYVRPHYKHSLKQRLSSSLEEREVLLLLMQLCSVLSHLQKHRVVHRDLQASNVFVDEFGWLTVGDLSQALSDHGTARVFTKRNGQPIPYMNDHQLGEGSAAATSPEIHTALLEGPPEEDDVELWEVVKACDVWAAGRMFVAALASTDDSPGDAPALPPPGPDAYSASALPALPTGVYSDGLAKLLHSMMAFDASQRPSAGHAVVVCQALLWCRDVEGAQSATEAQVSAWLATQQAQALRELVKVHKGGDVAAQSLWAHFVLHTSPAALAEVLHSLGS